MGKPKHPKQQLASTRRAVPRRAFLARLGKLTGLAVIGGTVAAKAATSVSYAGGRGSSSLQASASNTESAAVEQCQAVHDDLPSDADAPVLAFLGPIKAGMMLGAWKIERVHAMFHGALPFVLINSTGDRVQVDLMGHDAESPRGVAATARGQLYVVNSGRGQRFTPQDLVDAVNALADSIRGREQTHSLSLQSFAERHRCHPNGVFVVPL